MSFSILVLNITSRVMLTLTPTIGVNVYQWYYVSPIPWPIIMACVGSFLGLSLIGYLEYRRRMRKAAMERYAMKRMRRKFKAMQRELGGLLYMLYIVTETCL